jgi:hypothetical protein
MSYQLTISGHHKDDNASVKQIAEEAVHKLRAAGHTEVSLTGYTYNGAERVELSTPEVKADGE